MVEIDKYSFVLQLQIRDVKTNTESDSIDYKPLLFGKESRLSFDVDLLHVDLIGFEPIFPAFSRCLLQSPTLIAEYLGSNGSCWRIRRKAHFQFSWNLH